MQHDHLLQQHVTGCLTDFAIKNQLWHEFVLLNLCVDKAVSVIITMAVWQAASCGRIAAITKFRAAIESVVTPSYSVNQIKTGIFNAVFLAKQIKLISNE